MISRVFPLALASAISLGLVACGRISDADRKAAVECVRSNLVAMQKGDFAAVAATLHPKSPAFHNTPEIMQRLLKTYKLSYELEQCDVEKETSDGIFVHFVQVTKKLEGPDDFPDSRLEGMHLLKKDGKAWKIWFTQVRQSRTLNGDPLPVQSAGAEPPLGTPPPVAKPTPRPPDAGKVAAPTPAGRKATPAATPGTKGAPPLVPFRTQG